MFCQHCGSLNEPGVIFCSHCGKKITSQQPQSGFAVPVKRRRKLKTSAIIMMVTALLLLAGDIALLASVLSKDQMPGYIAGWDSQWEDNYLAAQSHGAWGKLELGQTNFEGQAIVDQSGADIYIDDSDSLIAGLNIHVPEGAYTGPVDFQVSTTQINGDTYGELVDPITPLITIDNGEVFAGQTLAVTIPIQKADDEFAMGVYYDEQTGELEAIPFLSQTNNEIVLLTRHFSAVFVTKKKLNPGRIVDTIDTNFRPGKDDIQIRNEGSTLEPEGYCTGQALAALYYYSRRDLAAFRTPLYGRFDNNEFPDTRGLWEDDSNLVRLCSALQFEYEKNPVPPAYQQYQEEIGKDDELVYYAFVYAMELTGHPQLIGVSKKGDQFGHTLLVYKIEGDTLWIADPNFQGQEKTIQLIREEGNPPKFATYTSGTNSKEAEAGYKEFDTFEFEGDFALIDERMLSEYWNQMFRGEKMAAQLFGDETTEKVKQVEVAISQDTAGNIKTAILTDDMMISENGMSTLNSSGKLMIRKAQKGSAANIDVYVGDTWYGTLTDEWMTVIELQTGNNDIGLYFQFVTIVDDQGNKGLRYNDFVRYNVIFGEAPEATPTPGPTPEPAPEPTPEPTVTPAAVTQIWELIGSASYSEGGAITPLDNYDQHTGIFIELPASSGEWTIDGYTNTYTYLPGNGVFAGFIEIRNEYSDEPRVLCIGGDGRIYENLFGTYPTDDATLDVYERIE